MYASEWSSLCVFGGGATNIGSKDLGGTGLPFVPEKDLHVIEK